MKQKKRAPEKPKRVSRRHLMQYLATAALASPVALVAAEQDKPVAEKKAAGKKAAAGPGTKSGEFQWSCADIRALRTALSEPTFQATLTGKGITADAITKLNQLITTGGEGEYPPMFYVIKTTKPTSNAKPKL